MYLKRKELIEDMNDVLMHIKAWMKKEIVLTIAVLLAIISCFWEMPKWSYIDVKVLVLLFNLMVVIAAFKEHLLLDYIAIKLLKRCGSSRQISVVLISLTFIAAMFMTNDVALITFVPLTLIIGQKLNIIPIKWIVFQTLAANLGSSLTPMGNPQNLFVYTYYDIGFSTFLCVTGGIVVVAALFLGILVGRERHQEITVNFEEVYIKNPNKLIAFLILFVIILSSVVGGMDYRLSFMITLVVTILLNRRLLRKVDYTLLVTFIGFFVFIGNLAAMPAVKELFQKILSGEGTTYFGGIILSQGISNVPAAMLLAPFTENWQELVLGVNIGGMGTLIASLASVISYKLLVAEHPKKAKHYFKSFTAYNLLGLVVVIPVGYILIKWLI